MQWLSGIVISTFLVFPPPALAKFVGTLKFEPAGCEKKRDCTLKFEFGFIDPHGIGWVSPAGDKTDGASIPFWAQPFIGSPFDKTFIKAAVIHDHYCNRHVRPESQTHEMFRIALLEGGVPEVKAGVMFYAVTVAARHWKTPVPGKKCDVGALCVQNLSDHTNLFGGELKTDSASDKVVLWPQSYDESGFVGDLRQVEAILEAGQVKLDINSIRTLAATRHPEKPYLKLGDTIPFAAPSGGAAEQ